LRIQITTVMMPKFVFGIIFGAFLIVLSTNMSNKRKRDEIAIAQERFNKMTNVIERGVLKPNIRVAHFDFIYHRFQENQWSSMLNVGGKIFPRLVREFYKNLVITNLHEQSPSFETKVRSVKICIDTNQSYQLNYWHSNFY